MSKSFMARIAAVYFRSLKKYTEAEWKDRIEARRGTTLRQSCPPKWMKYRFEQEKSGGVFYMNESKQPKHTVVFLHGGGFYNDFSFFHWRFLQKIIRFTNAEVIAPAYKLIPYGTAKDAYELIVPLLQNYKQSHPETKMILMGDSAGGGLALSLAEFFVKYDLPYPDELILFSPWVDVTMQNPDIPFLAEKDPWLTPSYRVAGLYWAGDWDPCDWRVSPIQEANSSLNHVTVFCGTDELFYSDCQNLFARISDNPTNELITCEQMNHVYPLIPCPEANKAMDVICSKILRS